MIVDDEVNTVFNVVSTNMTDFPFVIILILSDALIAPGFDVLKTKFRLKNEGNIK